MGVPLPFSTAVRELLRSAGLLALALIDVMIGLDEMHALMIQDRSSVSPFQPAFAHYWNESFLAEPGVSEMPSLPSSRIHIHESKTQ
jgi:hypothetical protein